MNVEAFHDLSSIKVTAQRRDLRRDLHVFVRYIRDRQIKRGYRDNLIPKADARRLVKMMSDSNADADILEVGYSHWLNIVDDTARSLGFVQYDNKGVYVGYSSQSPSFPDNFITFNAESYHSFLDKTLSQQETQLREVLLQRYQGSSCEFFSKPFFSLLDRFSSWGSATGVIPTIDFVEVRKFLLDLLAKLPTGEWLSTASLIAFVKHRHPYFLIPKKPKFENKWDESSGRYGNFHEGEEYGRDDTVKPSDEDAFERVEGRYIERFLESVPYLLGYVDVGYARKKPSTRPTLGGIPAFRVSPLLQRALNGRIAEPNVRITPSFEIYVQCEVHPARVRYQLDQIAELVSADATVVYRLTKQKVAAAQAADPNLDVVKLLESMSSIPLSDNVRREVTNWSQHSEKFVLYTGVSLLETEPEVKIPQSFIVETIRPGISVVHSPDELLEQLEQQERMPIEITHREMEFATMPEGATSLFSGKRRKSPKSLSAASEKPQVTLMRVKHVELLCPDQDFLKRLRTILLGAGCPVECDSKNLSLVYSVRYEADVAQAIRTLKNDYRVSIEDKG